MNPETAAGESGEEDVRARMPGMGSGAPAVLVSLVLTLACSAIASPLRGQIPAELRAQYDSAYFAWDRGDYLRSLHHAERGLTAPGGDILLERVALLTGELFRVHELSTAGRSPGWSPDGRYATYESRRGGTRLIHLIEVDGDGPREAASIEGWSARFSPDGRSLAFFRLPATGEAAEARRAVERAAAVGDAAALRAASQALALLEVTRAEVVVRDLADRRESAREVIDLERHALAYAGDGTPILIGRRPGEMDRLDLYLLPPDGPPQRITDGPGMKGAVVTPVGMDRLVFTIGTDRIGLHDRGSGETRIVQGGSPSVARDGSAMAYRAPVRAADPELRRGEAATGADARADGNVNAILVMPLTGAAVPREVKRTTLPLANPVLSPSGRRVAFNIVLRDDWEIVVVNADGTEEERVTRDVQHDLFPHFLTESLLLGLMGEARHRRAYLYDLERERAAEIAANPMPGDDQRGRIRLFHNNTLRTIAPQYEWVPSPDGTRLLIVADRDGDTLSPETGVYLVDLEQRVTRDEVLARIRAQRAAEEALRELGRTAFEPVAGVVRAAVAEVNAGRVYDHAHALFQFGSKWMTLPGNALAIEYLANTLRSMGYDPELQWFEPRPGVRTANVIATLRGTVAPDRINVISSHFDSVERSPGADDNSSGTTALLEVARVLASRPQPETIRFAFLSAEEAGLLGAFEFVRRARQAGDRIVTNLNNDMVGWTRSHRLDNTIRYSNARIRDLLHGAAILFTDLITYDARYVRSTDAQAFWDGYGDIVGGIGSYPILSNPHYHQPHDNLEVVNQRLVAEVAKTTLAAVMLLANGGSSGIGSP